MVLERLNVLIKLIKLMQSGKLTSPDAELFFHLISTSVLCKMAMSQNKKRIAMFAASLSDNLCFTCNGEQQDSYVSWFPSMLEALGVVK